jgi:HK97 family phage major capsid protein
MPQFLDRLYGEREAALALIDEVTSAAEADERDLSDAEQAVITRNQARVADELDPQIVIAEATETARSAHVRAAGGAPVSRTAPVEVIDREGEVIYRSFAEYARDQLITRYDAIAQRAGGAVARQAAEQRIERAVANTISTDVPGLLPPQYLTTIFDIISKSRPIVESARRVNLTSGLLRYPHITQKPIVGKQTAEKTEAPSQKMTVAFVDVPADTYVGAGDISWQVINWSTPDALALFFDLMAEQYAKQTEAAAGAILAALAAGAAPATDDLAGWTAAIAKAAGSVYSQSGRMADTIYADVTSGYKLLGMVSNASPVFLATGGANLSSSTVANIGGLALVISKGLAAGNVVVGDSQAMLAAETAGAPVELRAVEPALGGMEVGIIGAFVAKIVDAGAFAKLGVPT